MFYCCTYNFLTLNYFQVIFDVDASWLDLQLTPSLIESMSIILDQQLKHINDSKKLSAISFVQSLITNTWSEGFIPYSLIGFSSKYFTAHYKRVYNHYNLITSLCVFGYFNQLDKVLKSYI